MYSLYSQSRMVGDTAIFSQIIKNIAFSGKAESNIFANTQDYIDRSIWSMPIKERLADINSFTPPEIQSRNMLTFHGYIILYALAPFCYVMSPFLVVTIAQSMALAFNLWFIILLMREKEIPNWLILLICLFVISYPGWSMPAVYGAFYPDRLFMAAGTYLIWACCKKEFNRTHFFSSAILCALIGERGALYAGMFVLVHTILYWNDKKDSRKEKLTTGIVLLAYTFCIMKFVLKNVYYSGTGGNLNIFNYLASADNRALIILFLLLNIVVFGAIAFLEWRAAIIGFASLVPNLLYDVGGAEKTGWTLHYHVYYCVVLIWAVVCGWMKLYQIMKDKRIGQISLIPICPILLLSFIALINCFNPYDRNISLSWENIKNNVLINGPNQFKQAYVWGGRDRYIEFQDLIKDNIASTSKVTSTEGGMLFLIDNQTTYLFPMGVSAADYAVVAYTTNEEGIITYSGAGGYYDAEELLHFNNEIFTRMQNEFGYDFDNAVVYPAYSIAIIPRIK